MPTTEREEGSGRATAAAAMSLRGMQGHKQQHKLAENVAGTHPFRSRSASGRPLISIVIPTLNEEGNIRDMLDGVSKALQREGRRYELIVVDGHSTDRTVEIAQESNAKVIYENVGKGNALAIGLKAAKGDVIISMDADLSHIPEELNLLIAGIEAGYDVCMGSRFASGGGSDDMPRFRRLGNSIFVHLVNMLYGSHYSDMCYGYRSFSRRAVSSMRLEEKGFGVETEINILAKKANLSVIEVPSFEKKRATGEAKLKSFKDGWIILRTIFWNLGKPVG